MQHVCSGAGVEPASRYYATTFVDHVNDREFYGIAGAETSVNLYKKVLQDMVISVEDQVVEGDRVTSRFVVVGMSLGRQVRFNGITISRFDGGKIVEDWSVTDTLGFLRQLGLWRAIVVAVRSVSA